MRLPVANYLNIEGYSRIYPILYIIVEVFTIYNRKYNFRDKMIINLL